jgi:uncharacterized membrane protein YedE/YeeE
VNINRLVAILFVLFAVLMLLRIKRPFARADRFLLLPYLALCILLYLSQALPPLPLLLTLQNWNADASHTGVSILLFIGLCAGVALVSFWWAERSPFPGDRRLLQLLFALALVGGLLQVLSPTLLVTLLALQALVMGIAIATLGVRSQRAGPV